MSPSASLSLSRSPSCNAWHAGRLKSVTVTALLLVVSAAGWSTETVGTADNAKQGDRGAVSIQPSDNLCFGGLEDGKIIVNEPYLTNPYRETTRLGCEVDGGSPVTMPDLPAPDAAKTRMV